MRHMCMLPVRLYTTAAVDGAMQGHVDTFMKALAVTDSLMFLPCLEGSAMVLIQVAYDIVADMPDAPMGLLASQVADAGALRGLCMS